MADGLFDSWGEHRQQWNEIRRLEEKFEALDVDQRLEALRATVVELQRRAERSDLLVTALVRLLQAKGDLTVEELEVMFVRVDLADGVEDGRTGPDCAARAPTCTACGRPTNPQRRQCVYCGATLTTASATTASAKRAPRLVACAICGKSLPEHTVYFTERGMVCPDCFTR